MMLLPDDWEDIPQNIKNRIMNHHIALRLAKARRRAAKKLGRKSKQRNKR